MTTLTYGELFTGIGGLSLGLERSGMRPAWFAETDPFCSRVLAHHWPTVPNLGDVTTIDWKAVPRVDLIAGGYPCQPFSTAGKMLGAEDHRHLWPRLADALRVLRPRWALLENVPAHVGLGLDAVLADLASLGFDAEWSVVPAAAMGAPQRRPRLFVVAHPQGGERLRRSWLPALESRQGGVHVATDAHRCRTHVDGPGDAGPWTTQPDVGLLVDGVPPRLVAPHLRGLGNAVVPQVAEHVGRLVVEAAA